MPIRQSRLWRRVPPGLRPAAFLFLAAAALAQDASIDSARIYAPENLKHDFAHGELIVAFKAGALDFADTGLPARTRIRHRRDLGPARRDAGAPSFPERRLVHLVSEDTSRSATLENLERLRRDPNVAYVEPNYLVHAVAVPNDPSFSQLWALQNTGQTGGTPGADIDATAAWDKTRGDPNLLIGVIDTGIDYLHPDLVDNVWTNPGEIPGNGIDDDGNGYVDDVHGYNFSGNNGNPMDDNGHGTHCAGTIAARGNNGIGVAGVVWSAKLVALKFLDSAGNGTTAAAINAIAYANSRGITITNNSWSGSGYSQALKNAIDAAGAQGRLFVAAAGNGVNNNGIPNDNDAAPQYPASYTSSNIIAVAATDADDGIGGFSNYGSASVDLGAPGVGIYSTQPGNAYQSLSGTSMATPQVAGAAALLWSYNPGLTSTQVKNYILQGTEPASALSGKTVTGGRLNVNNALNLGAPPAIAYKIPAVSAIKHVAIPPDSVLSTGGPVTAYSVSPALPPGLFLNASTGVISGVPSAVAASAGYTVTATGPNGSGAAVVNITVADTAPAFAYAQAVILATRNLAIAPDTVVVTGTGAITGYSVSPPLPAGLLLDPVTGRISGTPSAASPATDYTVTASGPGGTGVAGVQIFVQDIAPSVAYARDTLVLIRDAAMTPDSILSTGGAVTGYSVAPSLPPGLVLNTATGVLSGAPTAQSLPAEYTVTATGPGGTGTVAVLITVYGVPANLSYTDDPSIYVLGIPITPNIPSVSGLITRYAVTPDLPPGLALDTLNGRITGTPAVRQSFATDYTVTAGNPAGSTAGTVNIAVVGAPSGLSYREDITIYGIGIPIQPPDIPTVHGIVTQYTVSPGLPSGLTLDQTTGYLQGTPSAPAPEAPYTITAQNPGGSTQTTLVLGVQPPP